MGTGRDCAEAGGATGDGAGAITAAAVSAAGKDAGIIGDRAADEETCRRLLSLNIKRCRSRLGLSQLNLAMELDISPNFLSDIETGKKWVSPHTLAELARALKIEIYELFKPPEAALEDEAALAARCLDDLSLALRTSVENAVRAAVDESLKNLRDYYGRAASGGGYGPVGASPAPEERSRG